MLRHYVKATEVLKRLRTDENGFVSFEYVMVALCILSAVAAAFGPGGAGTITTALSGAINTLTP